MDIKEEIGGLFIENYIYSIKKKEKKSEKLKEIKLLFNLIFILKFHEIL